MVILREIVLENFKTFRGVHDISFIGKFTAIIGPNGAGKSNFVDAISFVMGSKLTELRVSRAEELVSLGQRERRMQVGAVLQSENGVESRFERSVVNSRPVNYINDNVVTLYVYLEELKRLNINARVKNFLVFQGSIETIIMKKPSERTVIFEEISRSIKFKPEYDRLKTHILKYEQEYQYLQRIKRSITKEIKNSECCREKAQEYTKLSNEKDAARLHLMLFNLYHGKRKIDSLSLDEERKKKEIEESLRKRLLEEKKLHRIIDECEKRTRKLAEKELAVRPQESRVNEAMANLVKIRVKKQYVENQLNSCGKSLERAKNADQARELTVRELEDVLEKHQQKKNKYTEEYSATLGRDVKLSESEIQEYEQLKNVACSACDRDNQRLLILDRQCKALQDIFESENRRRNEKAIAIELKRHLRDAVAKRVQKLEDSARTFEAKLDTERASYRELTSKFETSKQDEQNLKHEIDKINEQIGNSKEDAKELAKMKIKRETVDKLRRLFTGVFDRLGNLCRPIHSRYNVAIARVLGKNIDSIVVEKVGTAVQCIRYLKDHCIGVETFLPLDQIREYRLMESLRNIRVPANVKLVFDVIDSPAIITKAVLYATRNTLVCETPDDAARLAFEEKNRHDCVSLDGCYYRTSGIMSGGNLDLARKAKQWNSQMKESLKVEKENLTKRLREILKTMPKESDSSLLAVTIKGLESRLKFIKSDEINGHKEMEEIEKELKPLEKELENIEKMWTKSKSDMDNALRAMSDLQSNIDTKENEIFADFCKSIRVKNIRDYENGKISFDKKITEFDEQICRIQVQLTFENDRDTKSIVERWEKSHNKTMNELDSIVEQENLQESLLNEMTKKLHAMQSRYCQINSGIGGLKNAMLSLREEIAIMARQYKILLNELYQIQHKIAKHKSKIQAILKEAQMSGFHIVATNRRDSSLAQDSEVSSSSATFPPASETNELEAIMQIDFSKLPENLRKLEDEEISKERKRLDEIVADLTSQVDAITAPNMRASQYLTMARDKLMETNQKLNEIFRDLKRTRASFETIKKQRCTEFMRFFDHMTEQLDAIYKKLMKNPAAQAYLLPENPEEPYLGGIRYDCLVPGKRYHKSGDLSGGEKTVAALPLLFAMQRVDERPPPFLVLDEIDAGLDHKNAVQVMNYIRENREAQQSIVITHRKEFYAGADVLFGIDRRVEGSSIESKILSFDLRGYRDKQTQL